MTPETDPRAVELLVDRATEGLPPELEDEVQTLLEEDPRLADDSFEIAAAAIELAYTMVDEPLPSRLRDRVAARASEVFAANASVAQFPPPAAEARRPRAASPWIGWLAAAAALAVAIVSWLPAPDLDPATGRAALVEKATDLIEAEWTATEDPAARSASGDLVWSTAEQTGYMRFVGLEANDPKKFQYQLWIFDAGKDERYPVDGGVFDVTSAGEVVVPIVPKLRVERPELFAVTIEPPGGVVVSSRERLPLLARVG